MEHRCHRRTDLMRGRTGDGDEECRELDVPVRQGGGRKIHPGERSRRARRGPRLGAAGRTSMMTRNTLVPARPHRMARLDDGDGLTRLRGRYRGGGVRASRGRARTPARRLRH